MMRYHKQHGSLGSIALNKDCSEQSKYVRRKGWWSNQQLEVFMKSWDSWQK